jgi:hypothetical protein
MPVTCIARSKGPFDGFKCDAGLDIGVLGDVVGVIIINERKAPHLAKNCRGDECQNQANPEAAISNQYVIHFTSEF